MQEVDKMYFHVYPSLCALEYLAGATYVSVAVDQTLTCLDKHVI